MKSKSFKQGGEGVLEQRYARFKYGCENLLIDLEKKTQIIFKQVP